MDTLEALTDLLLDLPLSPIQRHWADEYLRDLKDGYLDEGEREELEELRHRMSDIEAAVW
jgi:hypothetical protein